MRLNEAGVELGLLYVRRLNSSAVEMTTAFDGK
jgi:hypothetical protein